MPLWRSVGHGPNSEEDEFACLNLNVATPPPDSLSGLCPVMVWIHGGSLLFGSSSHPTYDLVRLVSHSIGRGSPVVCVSLNYRAGLFGFLASDAIQSALAADGHSGAGNFGLTDQQTGLAWVQRFISSFGGDPDNVTIFGESAGGMSVAHQIYAREPATFHRAICMSGNLNCIPVWPVQVHQTRYDALLARFDIDASDPKVALAKLRAVPQETLAEATCPIDGTIGTTGNACDDGTFYTESPSPDKIVSAPAWLQSYMLGNVKDEVMIFRWTIAQDDYALLYKTFTNRLSPSATQQILSAYDIRENQHREEMLLNVEKMATDCLFHIQDRIHLQRSKVPSYGYHMDQVSTLDNALKGLAYHAIDLLYVFMNMMDRMTPQQQKLAKQMSGDFIDFAHGKEPWPQYGANGNWRIYGPDDAFSTKTESEDEPVRQYSRMDRILRSQSLEAWVAATDDFVDKRFLMGTDSKRKKALF